MPQLAAEIAALVVDEVAWWWEKHPAVAMVWFKGGAEGRSWHATYENGKLAQLAYDD